VGPRAFPLPLRNALAALAIDALDDDDARAALAWLARPAGAPAPAAAARLAAVHLIDPGADTLLPVHASHEAAVRAHAERALRAAAAHRGRAAGRGDDPILRAVLRAAALWSEHLFFEVHEVLEQVWKTAAGPMRHALQGVIQIAVAYHHLAHGNPRGARTLMREGRTRLAEVPPSTLPALDLPALLAATAPGEAALAARTAPPTPPPPLPLVP
jgi:hypothetical protein